VFDVYLDKRRNLLVLKKGAPIPPAWSSGTWRKCNRRAVAVSDEIEFTIRTQGYYLRKPGEMKNERA
jgi:hypothetical protein